MKQAEFHIRTEHDGVLALAQAVLIYRGAQGSALATVHEVAAINGEATILAGKAMTPRAAITLATSSRTGLATAASFPKPCCTWTATLLWWARPGKRHIAFRAEC